MAEFTAKGANILVVDDDDDIREIVHILLAREGFTVREAANAEQALRRLDPLPDLVILDVMMPGLSGITVQGQDELGELAQGVEDMRRAMVSRETEKRQMEEATNRLMTSVSHDLRTPLTALLGYLEILEGDPRPASESPYLGKCRQRALQIRGMLNDLFEYFFVSTSDKTQADFPPCTVEQAFGKLLAEFADLLRQDDFAVNAPQLPSGTVRVNTGLLQRLFDNLLSNLRRYADRTQPVKITLLARDKELALIVSNTARPDAKPGTGLGLQNCAQMLRLHGGRFEHSLSDGVFTAAAYFPME